MRQGQEWEVNRCKRVIRPLLSRIHALSDLVAKNPLVLDLRPTNDISKMFVKPAYAAARFQALESFITPELYQAYREIFNVFQSIALNINVEDKSQTKFSLRSACCYQIGKAAVLSCRTSYYKLNQNVLFDADTLPKGLREYNKHLDADIDGWILLEPKTVFDKYRLDILNGYIVHLLVFHLSQHLYILIPVLVHWLYEELISRGNNRLRTMLTRLFYEFWSFHRDTYYDNLSQEEITALTGSYDISGEYFWPLFRHGYWDHFILSLGINSGKLGGSQYEMLILDTVVANHKLDMMLWSDMPSLFELLHRNPLHRQVNSILLGILTTMVAWAKADPQLTYEAFLNFLQAWLSFDEDSRGLYNPMAKGNDHLFKGLLTLGRYLNKHHDKPKQTTLMVVVLLRGFYSNVFPSGQSLLTFMKHKTEISRTLRKLQPESLQMLMPLKYSNPFLNEFLYWLVEGKHKELAKCVFFEFYGKFKKYYDDDLRYIHTLLT